MTPYEYKITRQALEKIWDKLIKTKGCETALTIVAQEVVRMDLEQMNNPRQFRRG